MMTSGAPQQQVVNGWVNRDLLAVISRQLSASIEQPPASAPDPRIAYLLLILVLMAAWHGATTQLGKTPAAATEPEPSKPTPPSPLVPEPDIGGQPRADGP